MDFIISAHFSPLSSRLFPPSRSPLNLLSFLSRNPPFLDPSPRTHRRNLKPIALLCSLPCNYGGWDDLELPNDPSSSGKLDPFKSFLISLGIDWKHAIVFVVGFLSALALFRGRFSSAALFPASVLVFAAGFSVGAARAGSLLDQIGGKDGGFGSFGRELEDLGSFLDELDVKMSDLRSGLEGAIGSGGVEIGSISNYVEVIEYVKLAVGNVRKSVEDSIAGGNLNGKMGVDWEGGKMLNQKASRKRGDVEITSFDAVQFVSGLFEEYVIGLRPPKAKDVSKGELVEKLNETVEEGTLVASSGKGSAAGNNVQLTGSKSLLNSNLVNSQTRRIGGGDALENSVTTNPAVNNDSMFGRSDTVLNGEKFLREDGSYGNDMLSFNDELHKLNKSPCFTTKEGSFEKLVYEHIHAGQTSQTDTSYSNDLGLGAAESMDFFTSKSDASLQIEKTLEIQDRPYFSSNGNKSLKTKFEKIHDFSSKQAMAKSEEHPISENQQRIWGTENGDLPLSSTISADEEFTQSVKEATDLLKQARKCIISQDGEETADSMLYRSERLLSTAVEMKPMSLLAVGQLGNAYLLHGELKLKITRELRTLLSRSETLLNGKFRGDRFKKLDTRILSRENVSSVLVDVCEECEGLLVEAGRNYRKALSIDGSDVRALYNWGLALSFRAQLIADIGPEAAFDADRVYLAAIDKFNAMMAKTNLYAPDALYRWGMALQQRSHLRPHNSREKIKLLHQAKSLFEDVLCAESDSPHVREALSSCISELNYNKR